MASSLAVEFGLKAEIVHEHLQVARERAPPGDPTHDLSRRQLTQIADRVHSTRLKRGGCVIDAHLEELTAILGIEVAGVRTSA